VIGNPPYVRQELIPPGVKTTIAAGTRRLMGDGAGGAVSLRSDLHLHFWPRAMDLLREGGRLGMLTSSAWLDASYGEPLRRWLGAGFAVVLVVESEVESWFDAARVRTAIAVVERRPPDDWPPARLARLKHRLEEIVPSHLPEPERLARFEALARDLEREPSSGARAGRRAPQMHHTRVVEAADLARGRWGPLLRMPDLYFAILSRAADRLVPLSQVATVRWGIKTGDDRVFFVAREEPPDLEPGCLVPAVFSLMELDRLVVTLDQIRRRLLLVDLRAGDGAAPKRPGPKLARYLRLAERERAAHLKPTCAAREAADSTLRRWFELRPGPPGEILWSIMHQYRHLAPWNPKGFPANDNLLLIRARPGVDPHLLAALLNSHLQALIKEAHGRRRNEGMLKTQAGDLKEMLVPDPGRIPQPAAEEVLASFDAIARRRIGKVAEECRLPDRRRLDLAVLAALGFGAGEARSLAEALADHLEGLQTRERAWERDAVGRRRVVRPAAPPSASARAARDPGFLR
jgi:Eco57I restriction-modification methylase